MSRVGKLPIVLPSGVNLEVVDGLIKAAGPKGALEMRLPKGISAAVKDGTVEVTRSSDEALFRARHGLARALLNNMITGVSTGFEKKLELNGVGFRMQVAGSDLKLNLGYSHEVNYKIPEGVSASVEQNVLTINGISKQRVGQTAAEIRSLRKPEPYKGKGIKYVDERILRKSGKSGKE